MSDDSDWSDSDLENGDDIETSVLLGVPDGVVDSPSDLIDVAVSRIGGHPSFLLEPPYESCGCRSCKDKMKLLIQMWCPFEDSPMDRALYIWGCAKKGCQGKPGSVRAWRGLRYNETYAAKLAKKKKKEKAEKAAEKPKPKTEVKGNPFSASASSTMPNPFGFGDQIFGGQSAKPASPSPVILAENNEDCESDIPSDAESDSSESLITALASTHLTESPWPRTPSYPPFYLSTASEYMPAGTNKNTSKDKDSNTTKIDEEGWMSEAYENSLNVDQVFERFTRRVSWEGEQCVRYELRGTPLPFSSDQVFHSLFPVSKTSNKRQFSPSNSSLVPNCELCKGERVFECQIMPNLINILERQEVNNEDAGDAKAEERAKKLISSGGMEWGTCLIFSCGSDCCVEASGKQVKECWREEVVLIQKDE